MELSWNRSNYIFTDLMTKYAIGPICLPKSFGFSFTLPIFLVLKDLTWWHHIMPTCWGNFRTLYSCKRFPLGCSAGRFPSQGCTGAWGHMEEPHAEPFAIVKEPFAFQIFPSFHDWKRIFLPWTLDWHITTSSGCKKYWPFHFFQQIPVIFRSQFLNFEPSKDPMILLKVLKSQFLQFLNSENPSSCLAQ